MTDMFVFLGFFVLAITSGQILRDLRPLNLLWILSALFSILATFFRPATIASNAWTENFKENLINALNITWRRQATEPQDKVYALYGVLSYLGTSLQPLEKNTPFEYMYFAFTRRIINSHNSMDILREAGVPTAVGESYL
jgi:hypothetical protein